MPANSSLTMESISIGVARADVLIGIIGLLLTLHTMLTSSYLRVQSEARKTTATIAMKIVVSLIFFEIYITALVLGSLALENPLSERHEKAAYVIFWILACIIALNFCLLFWQLCCLVVAAVHPTRLGSGRAERFARKTRKFAVENWP